MGSRAPVTAIGSVVDVPTLFVLWKPDEGRLVTWDEYPAGGVAPRIARRVAQPGTVYARGPRGLRPVRPDAVGLAWITVPRYYELVPLKKCEICETDRPNTAAVFDWSWVGPRDFATAITGDVCTACRTAKLFRNPPCTS